jgi:serine protease Do
MRLTIESRWLRWPLLGAATAGLFLGAIPTLPVHSEHVVPTKSAEVPRPSGKFGLSFAPVVKQVVPAVVKVFTSGRPAGPSEEPDMESPMLRRFFGTPQGAQPRGPAPRAQGIGSGVVVSEDGYILTNNHVVDGAGTVRVQLHDGRDHTAKVVGRDPKTDLAVLKIEARDLPHLKLADSDAIEVGDLVLAVGNPFGLGETVTTGIVSGKGRATLGLDYEDFIQTDAAINPGNSGGALVDSDGRLVGINTAILSRSGGNQGIGFAIPTNLARDVMDSLIKDGKVTRGQLGVRIQDVTPALAKELALGDARGALVAEVTPRSAAAKAGLETGDVVVEFDGRPVRDSRQLKLAVGRARPGASIPIKFLREGDARTAKVTVRENADELADGKRGNGAGAVDDGVLDGVTVADLDPATRNQAGLPERIRGALVTDVEPDSPSAQAGLQPGDVTLEINKTRVSDAAEAVRMTEQSGDGTTLLKLWSRGGTRFIVVDESKVG